MKKLTLIALVLVPALAFGEVAPTEVPAWLQIAMDFLVAVPYLGPVLLGVLKYLGVVAAVMTAVSTGLTVIAKSLQVLGQALGLVAFAQKVDALYQSVWPYVAWLSVYNSKKSK